VELNESTPFEYRASNSTKINSFGMAMLTSEVERGTVNRKICYTKESDR
jgi:hypothetical protein